MADITIKDYLETATDSAKRVRTTTIILATATVLLVAGFANSIESAWLRTRIRQLENPQSDYTLLLLNKFDTLILSKRCSDHKFIRVFNNNDKCREYESQIKTDQDKNEETIGSYLQDSLKNLKKTLSFQRFNFDVTDFPYISFASKDRLFRYDENSPEKMAQDYENWRKTEIRIILDWYEQEKINLITSDPKIINSTDAQIKDAYFNDRYVVDMLSEIITLKEQKHQKMYEYFIRAAIENVYIIKIPFFNVAFDINDLSLIGGIGVLIILLMLRLSLRSYITSLRVGFKFAFENKESQNFYDILAARQLFVFPRLKDNIQESKEDRINKHQSNYVGSFQKIGIVIKRYSLEAV